EIEAVLREHWGVKEAAVINAATETESQLLAFVVVSPDAREAVSEIQDHVQANLPAHMTPSVVIRIDELPFTVNGKLDRAALLRLKEQTCDLFPEIVLPRTDLEQAIARIWQTIFNTNLIGINHNFFAMGGNSLLALKVMTELSSQFRIRLPLRTFFDAPTIRELSNKLGQSIGWSKEENSTDQIVKKNACAVPASLAQQGVWLIGEMDPGNCAYNMHRSILINGPLDPDLWEKALEAVTHRHEALRTTFALQ